jgi:hypothetical protein
VLDFLATGYRNKSSSAANSKYNPIPTIINIRDTIHHLALLFLSPNPEKLPILLSMMTFGVGRRLYSITQKDRQHFVQLCHSCACVYHHWHHGQHFWEVFDYKKKQQPLRQEEQERKNGNFHDVDGALEHEMAVESALV